MCVETVTSQAEGLEARHTGSEWEASVRDVDDIQVLR